jgi:hypothetical protein
MWVFFQIQALFKEAKVANITVQIEKEIYFQHLLGLGANMVQINDNRRVYRAIKNDVSSFLHIEKCV